MEHDICDSLRGLACGAVLAESIKHGDLQKYSCSEVTELQSVEMLLAQFKIILGSNAQKNHFRSCFFSHIP